MEKTLSTNLHVSSTGEKFLIKTYGGNVKKIVRLSENRLEVTFSPITRIATSEMDTPIIFVKAPVYSDRIEKYVREGINPIDSVEYILTGDIRPFL